MNDPHHELATSYLSDAEIDAAEVIASYSTDEVELHRLARQTLPQLIREVRLHRIDDHPADRTHGSFPQESRHPTAYNDTPHAAANPNSQGEHGGHAGHGEHGWHGDPFRPNVTSPCPTGSPPTPRPGANEALPSCT